MPDTSSNSRLPLVVDLDGTLSRVDTLHESILKAGIEHPASLPGIATVLLKGKRAFKSALAEVATPDASVLPLREEVLEFIGQARSEGRRIILATGAHRRIADAIGARTELFDEIFATEDEGTNLTGTAKAALLQKRFGTHGFDYVGDSAADIAVWRIARNGYCVGTASRSARLARQAGVALLHLQETTRTKPAWKAFRPHQWAKNILVFLPIVAAHEILNAEVIVPASLAFVAYCLAASLVYVLNDLLDRESDRRNPAKATRPIASGALSIPRSLAIAAALAVGVVALATVLPWRATAALGVYLAVNAAYTLHVKRRLLADVFLLAFMYVWRIETGALATGIVASPWLLGFTGSMFLSLAFAKRYAEVARLQERGENSAAGRAWKNEDSLPLAIAGLGCGLSGSIILALYVTGETFARSYNNAQAALLLSPLFLYWIIRLWVQTTRLELHEDPVLFAAKDRISYLVAALGAAILLLASF